MLRKQATYHSTEKGALAVGLAAAVHKYPVPREWTLGKGAHVLANIDICLVD
jgi:DNA replication licensing factor MCM2